MESLRRLITVLTSPGRTFRAIAERPTWVAPLVVLLLLGGLASALATYKIDPASQEDLIREQLEGRGLSGAELEEAVERGAEVTSAIRPIMPVLALGGMTVGYLLITVVLWGGVRALGGEASFVTGLSTTLHGLMPQGVAAVLVVPFLLSVESVDAEAARSGSLLASNLAVLAPEDASAVVQALLGSFDFFTIWCLVLLTLGFHLTARISKGASATVVLGGWALWIAAKVGFTALVA